jgi:formate dehydrogenase subunit delta
MSEKMQKLVRMANQIADFFGPYGDPQAVAGIQEHLRSFWTPAMLKELRAYAEADGNDLRPRVILALKRSTTAESPIEKVTAGPKELGQATSDAG